MSSKENTRIIFIQFTPTQSLQFLLKQFFYIAVSRIVKHRRIKAPTFIFCAFVFGLDEKFISQPSNVVSNVMCSRRCFAFIFCRQSEDGGAPRLKSLIIAPFIHHLMLEEARSALAVHI